MDALNLGQSSARHYESNQRFPGMGISGQLLRTAAGRSFAGEHNRWWIGLKSLDFEWGCFFAGRVKPEGRNREPK
jgi:hypothetical protein